MLYRLSRVQCFFMGKTKTDQNYCVDAQTDWNLLCGHIPTGVLCWILAHIIMKYILFLMLYFSYSIIAYMDLVLQ